MPKVYVYTDKQENSTRKWVETVPGYYRVDSLGILWMF